MFVCQCLLFCVSVYQLLPRSSSYLYVLHHSAPGFEGRDWLLTWLPPEVAAIYPAEEGASGRAVRETSNKMANSDYIWFRHFFNVPKRMKSAILRSAKVRVVTNGFTASVYLERRLDGDEDSDDADDDDDPDDPNNPYGRVDYGDHDPIRFAETIDEVRLFQKKRRSKRHCCFSCGTNVRHQAKSDVVYVAVDPGHCTIMHYCWNRPPDGSAAPSKHGTRRQKREWRLWKRRNQFKVDDWQLSNSAWAELTGLHQTRRR